MAFEVYERERTRTMAPRVTINSYGRFSISNSASELMRKNQEGFVLLLWDKSTNTVGIRPIQKPERRAYPLKTYGPKGRGGTGFSAVTFLNHINYDWSDTHSYDVEWRSSENMLTLTIPPDRLKGRPATAVKIVQKR